MAIVTKVEDLCLAIYTYFGKSPKRHLEFMKLAKMSEIEGLRRLTDVKTRWISLLDLKVQWVLGEYKTLTVKMNHLVRMGD